MEALDYFFLTTGYKDSAYFEKRKASYLYYIILTILGFMLFVGIGQYYFGMGPIYLAANICAVIGAIIALVFFLKRKINAAGHILACSLLVVVILENVVRDFYSTDPSIRYRIYIDMVSLMGIDLLVISFFREKKYVVFYGAAFVVILFAHSLVINHQIKDIPYMSLYVWEHFVTVSTGVLVCLGMGMWLLSYMDALLQQNEQYAQRFKLQNEYLEKMVDERTHDLQSSNKNLREFAYIVSHDLKEPLRTISGFVTLIKRELDKTGMNDSEINEYIRYVTRGTHQMEMLINDILAYSKLNVVEKHFAEVDVADVIADVRKNLAKAIYESEAEIYIQNTICINGQKALLDQLFQNLLSNAIKYRSHDRDLKITVGSIDQDGMITYFVRDNGIGIPEEYFETIFKAFRRLHSKALYEGTGVGLAICKKIVEIHGGEIWVESKDGEGSTFWFTLPAVVTELSVLASIQTTS
jgi:signal transduction histidine kinase